MPLQLGPLWYAGFASVALVGLAGTLSLAYAVYSDADARGSDHALSWGVGSLFSPLVLPYLLVRSRLDARGPPSERERLARTVAGAAVAAFVVGAVFAPPDPLTQVLWFWPSLVVAAPVSYLLFYRR